MEVLDWFEEKAALRKKQEMELFQDACTDLAAAVQGEKVFTKMPLSSQKKTTETARRIFDFYHIRPGRIQVREGDFWGQMEELLQPHGMMHRKVKLKDGWYGKAAGAFLGFTKEGEPTALLPGNRGYRYFDYETGKWVRVNRENWKRFQEQAVCFYKPLPMKPVGGKELLKFCWETLGFWDGFQLAAAFLAVSLAGLAAPYLTWYMFERILPESNQMMLAAFAFVLAGTSLSLMLLSAARTMAFGRCSVKISVAVEAAVFGRMLCLPAEFFKKYSAGELAKRMDSFLEAVKDLMGAGVQFLLSLLCALVSLLQIGCMAPELFWPALGIFFIVLLMHGIGAWYQVKLSRRQLLAKSKTAGVEHALYSGIQKLKLAGAERRAFANWARRYQEYAKAAYRPPMLLTILPALAAFAVYGGWAFLFGAAAKAGMGQAGFMAFCSSWALVTGAIQGFQEEAGILPWAMAAFDMAKPSLQELPEHSQGKERVKKLSGGIEVSHVSFRYAEHGSDIIRDLSLKIRPGQYVGIVGRTGCGKSTLLRLLLGFEHPKSGAVYYDRKDIRKLDLASLRQNIGSVLQEGGLFDGDILSNITIGAPWLGLKDAWEAAKTAGIAEDIREMPMGMHTIVSEGSGTISGGQKQRILIARAIVSKPKILMFDEATSALDNLNQRKVTEALGQMKCTRIVIAHRLSTIQRCDKIFVMDEGRIAEEGKYEDLIKKDGVFADLVKGQQLV